MFPPKFLNRKFCAFCGKFLFNLPLSFVANRFAYRVIKIAHNMALKNIPYLFFPVCLVSGVRFQVPAPLFIIPDT
jgi:hypothetical protein